MATLKEVLESLNKGSVDDCLKHHQVLMEAMGISPDSFFGNRSHFYNIEQFFEHEHILTKPEVFWFVCSWAYTCGGRWDDRWLDVFSRYDRLDDHFNKKLQWCNYFRERENTAEFYDFLKKKNQEDDLTLYRTFKVRRGYPVRKGVKKLDNPDALIQEEGKGSSFTFSKIMANWFLNHHYHNYFYRTYGGVSDRKEQLRIMKERYPFAEESENNEILSEDSYACIGTYSLKKKDIFMVMANGEEEVICDPNSIDVLRYDFIGLADSLGASMAETWRRRQKHTSTHSWKIDEDEILDVFVGVTKQLYESPDLLQSFYQRLDDDNMDWWKGQRNILMNYLTLDRGGKLVGKQQVRQ